MKSHRMKPLTALCTAAMLACGGGDAPEPEQSAPPPPGVSGQAPTATQATPSVVTLAPVRGATAAAPSEPAVMDQLGLVFTPTTLLVRPGQTVRFVNSETLAHNVHIRFADDDSTVFIADLVPKATTETAFERQGGYDVSCDEHPGMSAFIFVTDAPWATVAALDGGFALPDVPAGSYMVSAWSASPALRSERRVEVTAASTVLDLAPLP